MLARALLSMSTFDTNILRNGAELQFSEQPLPIARPIHIRGDDLFFVYLITIFLNAALLFLIEPMVAKMILPFLGGTPAVWNLSLFFFQALLLAGYLYAHLGNSWLGPKRHALVHLAIVVFAVVFLPVVVRNHWFAVPVDQPERIVLSILFVSVGFPFFVLAAGSPLIQKWFANTTHPVARDPYFLYAASNLGSIVGLIAYPTILEPYFSLADQSRSWFYGYLALIAFTSACVFFLWRFFFAQAHEDSPKPAKALKAYASLQINSSEVTLTRRIRWLVLSFVPSSLLLGVTTYVTTDVASVPLFWIIPLALYLLSFVITFSRRVWISHSFVVRRQGFLLLAAAITVFAQAPAHHYQLFVLDAFSSDVIPVHLLTREAIQLYLSKLDENGILFFHISNRYMDLVPVLDRLGSSLSLVALVRDDVDATSAEQEDGKTPSRWVIMSRRRGVVAEFLSDPSWKLLDGRSAGDLWTDDYSNILRVIHWKS
jgi:hypothetical protein